MSKNYFGVLSNYMLPDDDEPKFVFETKAWQGFWKVNKDEPTELVVHGTHGYRVSDWHDDIDGGPGLCFFVEISTTKNKNVSVQIMVPKDELIKALGLLADSTSGRFPFDWQQD